MTTHELSGQDLVRHSATDCLEIILHLKEGIAVLRDGRFADANPAFFGITGCRREALMGREVTEPFPEPERAAIRRDHDAVLRTGQNPNPHEFWMENDGAGTRIEMTMTRLRPEESATVLLTVVDVTPRRRRMDEIRKLNDRLESILHSMHDAVISLSAVAYAVSARVAGDEMNDAIQRYFQDKFQMLIGENQSERIKMQIGSATDLGETLTGEVSGKNMVDDTPRRVEVTDAHIREAIREPVAAIVMAVRRALEKTPPELVGDVARNGLLLAGGGALLKGLDQLLSRETNLNVIVDDDPLTTVVRGTGRTLDDVKKFGKVYIN